MLKNLSKKIKEILIEDKVKRTTLMFMLIWLISLSFKAFYVQFTIQVNKAPVITMEHFTMGLALMASFAVLMGIVIMLFPKNNRPALLGADILLTLILLADMLYGRYYYNPITVPILKQIGFLGDVKASTASLFKIKDLILFLDFPFLIYFMIYLRNNKQKILWKKTVLAGFAIVIAGMSVFAVKYQFVDDTKYQFERKYIGTDLGLVYYHYYDIKYSIKKALAKEKVLTQEEKEFIESANRASFGHDNSYTDIAKGKNLIIIQLEAFQNYPIDLVVDGEEVTPFLNSLKEKSIYASNFYFETAGGNTVDAELLTNTSNHPTYGGSAYFEFPNNSYISLPKKLKELGYRANSFHGYEASFWNREVMHKTLGFDRFYSLNDFEMTEKVGWAISDKAFFKQSIDLALKDSNNNPFYAFMVTLSSHHPFDAYYKGPFTNTEQEAQILSRRYLNAMNYVDGALADFFSYLEQTNLLEDTLVVIYGDHAGIFTDDIKDTCEILGVENSNYQWQRLESVPLFITGAGIDKAVEIKKPCGQSDIMPTIANMMGFEIEYTMSQDIMDEAYSGDAIRRNNNIITKDYIYIAQEDQTYDFSTGKKVDKAIYDSDIRKKLDQLLIQDLIYQSDYLKTFEQE